jgi:hypothetical protein
MSTNGSSVSTILYETGKSITLSAPKWMRSQLQEHLPNRQVCSRCRTALRRSGTVEIEPVPGQLGYLERVFATSELLEDTLGRDCVLCLLFLNTLTEKDRETMRSHKSHSQIVDENDREPEGFRVSYRSFSS